MQPLGVVVDDPLAAVAAARPGVCPELGRERSRLEWRLGDSGDPAAIVEDFLGDQGITVRDLSVSHSETSDRRQCVAALFVSSAAGAVMAGGHTGPPSPAPAVPDLVAVVYEQVIQEQVIRGHGMTGLAPAATDTAAPASDGWTLGPWQASWTESQHAEAVRQVLKAIARGDVYQVNVVGHASAPYRGDPIPALRRVTALPGAEYAGMLTGDGWAIACASPETLLQVRGGRVVTRPIKGTAPADEAGRRALLASLKERAEHVMIVDLSRNDLAHVAAVGTVEVPRLFAVRRWADLWQAESDVVAQLRPGTGLADLLRALCPGGSVTGAPKLAALAAIARLEPVGRGPSMGAFGWIGPNGIDLGLTIRTVVADRDRLHVWAGGGITIDSDPQAEVVEAAAKAAPIRAALAS